MKAVLKTRREPGAVEVREVERPRAGFDDVLVKVQAGSICGSDVHVYEYARGFDYIKPPFILGHEFTGVVEAVGERVEGFAPGDRVVSEGVYYCGQCPACRTGHTNRCRSFRIVGLHFDGGFAEYAAIPARYAHRVPETISPERAALVEPVSIAVHALAQGPRIEPGDLVVVTGVGPIGLLVAQLARLSGAAKVLLTGVDVDEERRVPVARGIGLQVVNVQRESLAEMVEDLTEGNGADVVYECSGAAPAMLQGIEILRKGGHLVLLGLQSTTAEVFFTPIIRRELSIRTSITSVWKDFEAAIGLIARDEIQVQPLITTFPLDAPIEALEASLNRQVLKAVLVP